MSKNRKTWLRKKETLWIRVLLVAILAPAAGVAAAAWILRDFTFGRRGGTEDG